MALKPSCSTQRRTSRTACIGLLMSTEPTPMSRSGASATKPATSSFEIITLRGAYHALIRALATWPASIAATVAFTGIGSVGAWRRVQRSSEANMSSCRWRSVGCWAQASMIIMAVSRRRSSTGL